MFLDKVTITVESGAGGKGAVSFRREKFIPHGGPDGGKGGEGGSVILRVDQHLSTLVDLRYKHHIKAKRGQHGGGNNKSGKSADDVIVRVPAGTVVFLDSGEKIGDLTEIGQELVVAKGGKGGKGNSSYATPQKRAPRDAQPGQPGEEKTITLELKLIADVGLVGLPNAGKSTLLSRISAARPEIADYPFTTLKPHLGIVNVGGWDSFVVADIPGLIAGASKGKGLGHQFLRHIERTRVLAFLIDATDPVPGETLETLKGELEQYNPELMKRPQVILRSKCDLPSEQWGEEDLSFSSVTGEGLDSLLQRLSGLVSASKESDEISANDHESDGESTILPD